MLPLQPFFSPSRLIRSLAAGWQMVIPTLSLFRNREVLINCWRLVQLDRGRFAGVGARSRGQTTRPIH